MPPLRVQVTIRGRVQGVGFRAFAEEEAERLGLAGFVRNRHDGSVELVAEGEEALLERLVLWCHHGPPGALVDDVAVERGPATGEFAGFSVRRST